MEGGLVLALGQERDHEEQQQGKVRQWLLLHSPPGHVHSFYLTWHLHVSTLVQPANCTTDSTGAILARRQLADLGQSLGAGMQQAGGGVADGVAWPAVVLAAAKPETISAPATAVGPMPLAAVSASQLQAAADVSCEAAELLLAAAAAAGVDVAVAGASRGGAEAEPPEPAGRDVATGEPGRAQASTSTMSQQDLTLDQLRQVRQVCGGMTPPWPLRPSPHSSPLFTSACTSPLAPAPPPPSSSPCPPPNSACACPLLVAPAPTSWHLPPPRGTCPSHTPAPAHPLPLYLVFVRAPCACLPPLVLTTVHFTFACKAS